MIKNKSSLEVKVGERMYQFICDMDSPLNEACSVLKIMKEYSDQLLKNAIEKAEEIKEQPCCETPDCCPTEDIE